MKSTQTKLRTTLALKSELRELTRNVWIGKSKKASTSLPTQKSLISR